MTQPRDRSDLSESEPGPAEPDSTVTGWRKILFRLFLAAGVTGLFLYLLFRFAPLDLMLSARWSASPGLLAGAFLLVVLGQVLRGWRVAILVTPRALPGFTAYRISVLHSFLASLLPARLGELALPAMLKRSYGIGYAKGTGILLGARILDLLIILSLAGVSFWIVVPSQSELSWLRAPALLGGFAAAAAFLAMMFLRPIAGRLAGRLAPVAGPPPGNRLLGLVVRLLSACAAIPPQRLLLAQVASLALWLAFFAAYHLAALAVTPHITVGTSVLAGTLGSIAFVLPVNGVAQVGPFEAAWTFGGVLGGLPAAEALAAAVAIHAVTFAGGALQAAFVLLVKLVTPLSRSAS